MDDVAYIPYKAFSWRKKCHYYVTIAGILWARCLIENSFLQTFALLWLSTQFAHVCILIDPIPLPAVSANVIIKFHPNSPPIGSFLVSIRTTFIKYLVPCRDNLQGHIFLLRINHWVLVLLLPIFPFWGILRMTNRRFYAF